jgi:RHS repeat-associated protein
VRVINGTYSDVQTTFLHTDAAGSPVAATDAAGTRIWTQEYDPFGLRVSPQPAALSNRQWFHGKAQDAETGFQYFGARYYDPLIGRFMGIDAAGVKDDNIHSFNRYSFANNNPYRFTDPDGNSPIDVLFLAYDVAKLGVAIYSGVGVGAAVVDVGLSVVGVVSPFPGTGQVLKTLRTVDHAVDAARTGERGLAAAKVDRIHGALDPVAQSKRTTALGLTADAQIAASGASRNLSPAQRKVAGELGATEAKVAGKKHAEVKVMEAAEAQGRSLQSIHASRKFCADCSREIQQRGGKLRDDRTATFGDR